MPKPVVIPYPEFSYGQLTEGHTLRTQLPEDKHLVYTPPLNRDPAEYLAAGATGINTNGGVPFNQLTLPVGKRGVCGDVNFIEAFGIHELNRKPLREWTQAECERCARMYLSDPRQMHHYWTSQAGEAYDEEAQWALPDGSQQMRWITEAFAARLDEADCLYFGEYRGFGLTRSFTENFDPNAAEILRPGFTNDAAALDLLRRSTADDFLHEGYKFRHGLITGYYSGQIDPQRFLAGHLADCSLQLPARRALGPMALRRLVLGFPWFGEYQTMQPDVWHITYHTDCGNGGQTTHTRPPRYAMPINVGVALIDMALLDGTFGWESTLMYGTDPAVVTPDHLDIGGAGCYTGPDTRRAAGVSYYRPDVTAGYAPHPLGYQDAPLVAANWVSQAHAYSHWGNMRWCRAKRSASTNFFSNGPAYVLDRYQQDEPWFLEGGKGGKGWLLVLDFSGTFGQVRDWDVDTSLGLVSVRHTSGSARLYTL